ncbi:SAM-dependent methyltransferase [Kutzneria sp. CA-103260]|uniref:SAM-dependent methyltransferase n=1 Tax=Kutzneria sp. CA-103260 TaxID=2802641 RepID=UPI001BAE265C|nr:cyclopropane-fatty-acyl-phospholipid synthase family protein [Kutzneria sp. CA-103260]QUQ71859.1 cyclopropane-fatty-acyl-phospholipid synthase [Kutzneria sp. CA-103260]
MRLAELFSRTLKADDRIEFVAYDGSRSGPADAEVRIEIRSPFALSYLASAPGELGLARAYVTGHLEVVGDLHRTFHLLGDIELGHLDNPTKLELLGLLAKHRFWWPVSPPPQEARPKGWRHSKSRDAQAISHHYDVSNRFYEWVLGPSMAYTCAVYPTADASLETAQFTKHDLVARKLGLTEGMRLLDVGCGWGGMVMHAAEHYGVKALGVTLSRSQAEWAQKAIVERGLQDLAEVRFMDYRDVPESGFDAVSSIGLTEHIGGANLPSYFSSLYSKLRDGGRLLNHCITRPSDKFPFKAGGFITRYIFPDGELEGPGYLMSRMNDAGFEIRHSENIREHYAKTLGGWCANLDEHWDEAVEEVGLPKARIWRLYLAACQWGFDVNNIQLHQILGVKLDGTTSHMPLRPSFEPPQA